MQSAEREIGELKSLVETQALALATTTESEKTLQVRRISTQATTDPLKEVMFAF